MNEKAVPVASALATVIEHAAEAYGEERGEGLCGPHRQGVDLEERRLG